MSPLIKRFTSETMAEIIAWLSERLQHNTPVQFELPIENRETAHYPGELRETTSGPLRLRTLQNLVDLGDALNCTAAPVRYAAPWMEIILTPRAPESQWHQEQPGIEKYGMNSKYQRIQKLEDPSFLSDLHRSMKEAHIDRCRHLINLGVNTGDELIPVMELNSKTCCVGIDHSPSAIAAARTRFESTPHTFLEMDINQIDAIDAAHHHRYDLFMSLGTLHSPSVDSKRVFMWCMQHLLAKDATVIIGFPNCRWGNGHPVPGARTRNRKESDMSLVIKDVYFVKKYLQQHRFNTVIFGKYYLFVVGTPVVSQIAL